MYHFVLDISTHSPQRLNVNEVSESGQSIQNWLQRKTSDLDMLVFCSFHNNYMH